MCLERIDWADVSDVFVRKDVSYKPSIGPRVVDSFRWLYVSWWPGFHLHGVLHARSIDVAHRISDMPSIVYMFVV